MKKLTFALPLALALLFAATSIAFAQATGDGTPPPDGGGGGGAFDLAGAFRDALKAFLRNDLIPGIGIAFTGWFNTVGPGAILKFIGAIVGLLAAGLNELTNGLMGGFDILFQLPPAFTYELSIVTEVSNKLKLVAWAMIGFAMVLDLLWIAMSRIFARPFGAALAAIPNIFVAVLGLQFASSLMRIWIDMSNAISGFVSNPATGLPGLANLQGVDYFSALGIVAILYVIAAFVLIMHRLKMLVLAAMLLIIYPLGIAAVAFPFEFTQRMHKWWLRTFLVVTFVQVPQAVTLGIGAALISAPTITGKFEGPRLGIVSAIIGASCIIAARAIPGMLMGSLAYMELQPGIVRLVARVTAMLSGVAFAGTAGAVAPGAAMVSSLLERFGLARAAAGAGAGGAGFVSTLARGAAAP